MGKITGVYYDTTKKVNDIVYTEFTRYEIDHDGFGGLQIMRAATGIREGEGCPVRAYECDEGSLSWLSVECETVENG